MTSTTRPRRPTPAPAPRDLGVVDGLVQLSFAVQGVLARVAGEHDLSVVQTRLLGVLRDREPGMLALARLLDLEKSSVTGLVDRAERRGLVQRTTTPDDRRAVRVALTAAGRAVVTACAADVARAVDDLVGDLARTDRARLADLATRVVHRDATTRGVDLAPSPVTTAR